MTAEPRRFARILRHRQTSFEEALWHQLRARRLDGAKWRRQVPLGPYTADFLCLDAKLIVEVDGAQHASRAGYDAGRTRDLRDMGFEVLRFTNEEVRRDLDGVLTRIQAAQRRPFG